MKNRHSRLFALTLSLAGILSFGLAAGAQADVVLWNQLGNDTEVQNSMVGEDGTVVGSSHAYEPAQYDNGYVRKAVGNNYVRFPETIMDDLRYRGTVELWVNPKVPNPAPYSYGIYGIIGTPYRHYGVPDCCNVNVYWGDGVSGLGMYGAIHFGTGGVSTPVEPTQFIAPVGVPVHVALAWDYDGIDGTADRLRLYRDGTLVSSTTSPWDPTGTVRHPLILGYGPDSGGYDKYIVDNLIIRDFAKTDFSDRFTEEPFVDTDGDGIPDSEDVCPLDFFNDSDGDGVCDSDDLCLGNDLSGDNDADGLCDDSDPCFGASNIDTDGDAVCDEGDLCWGDDATGNSDGDGVCNDLDVCEGDDDTGDTDADLFCDDIDACPLDVANDADGDGICELDDNCDVVPNSNQSDNDLDGDGDVCDADDDNDGVLDVDDNCQLDANSNQADFDGDGAGDVCDTDDDNDGVLDAHDACLTSPTGAIVNGDGCAIADLCPCDNNWKNHGAYVRCVTHTANDFIDLGLVGETEHGDIVSDAGQSDCGHRN